MDKRGVILKTYGEDKLKEIEAVRFRLMEYKNKCQPYYPEPSEEDRYIIATDPAADDDKHENKPISKEIVALAQQAKLQSQENRRDLQEHFKHHSYLKKKSYPKGRGGEGRYIYSNIIEEDESVTHETKQGKESI